MLNVLIVDDDPSFQDAYQKFLERQGYRSRSATSRAQAIELWRQESFDVVLLDLRLQGGGTSDDGIDLLDEVKFSTAKVIVMTGFASEESIRRAYDLGAFDYIVKGPRWTPTLLAAKLDQIRELARARQRGEPAGQQVIEELWRHLVSGTSQARGRQLEELVLRLLGSVPGFQETWHRLQTDTEEIDVTVRNESVDEFWRKQGSYLLVEAKNWARGVGAKELRDFGVKVERRNAIAHVGFFVAPGGFTESLSTEIRDFRSKGVVLVPVDRAGLEELVRATSRSEVLKRLHMEAAIAT